MADGCWWTGGCWYKYLVALGVNIWWTTGGCWHKCLVDLVALGISIWWTGGCWCGDQAPASTRYSNRTRICLSYSNPTRIFLENDRVASSTYHSRCWIVEAMTSSLFVNTQEFDLKKNWCYSANQAKQNKANTIIGLKQMPTQVNECERDRKKLYG